MAVLTIQTEDHMALEKPLVKGITLIGSDPVADVHIKGAHIPGIVARIQRSATGFTLSQVSLDVAIHVNGTRIIKHEMTDQDVISIHNTRIRFYENFTQKEPPVANVSGEIKTYERLAAFTTRLSHETDVPSLLEILVDEIMALTHAERAFLVVLENDTPRVKVARNMHGEAFSGAVNEISDTILSRVLATRTPFVVSDALNDGEFNASVSVINFKLASVMCAPLLAHGQLLGAIYLGNNGVVNAFNEGSLQILSIFAGQAALIVKNAMLLNTLKTETSELRARLDQARFGSLIGNCAAMQDIFSTVEKAADSHASVLICGATGTGKELVARELHRRSKRHSSPFVVVNCAAIPEHLLECELFGHVRGAFEGAYATKFGSLQKAHQGTLVLDEVGEIPHFLQLKILRALEEKKITKIGDTKAEALDMRVVAMSSHKLSSLVGNGLLREDFYHHLATFPIEIPSLRERGNDVILIANYFLQKHAKITNKVIIGFTEAAQNTILNYKWPGNVRELEKVICRAVTLSEKERIGPGDLNIDAESEESIVSLAVATDRFRNQYISDSLERNAGNRTRAAKELGVDPRTIFRHLEDLKRSSEGKTDV